MKSPGLMMLLGSKAKGEEGSDDEPMSSKPMGSSEDAYIDEFVSAVKSGDKIGAREALKAAVKACMSASEDGEYEETGDFDEEE